MGGYVISISTATNEKYLLLCIEIEKILENPQLDTLYKAYRRPFENLLSADDIDWEYGGRQRCNGFQSQIDEMYIRNGTKEFELDDAEHLTLTKIKSYVNALEKTQQDLDKSFLDSKKIITKYHTTKFEDLNKKKIPKTEDKWNEFKEFYQYDADRKKSSDSMAAGSRSDTISNKELTVLERFAATVCSFGNDHVGGFIYLGIKSDGTIMGLEKDMQLEKFDDYGDSFSNHIRNKLVFLLKDKPFVTGKLQVKFRNIKDKTICIIQVLPSNQPLFLHIKKRNLFYARGSAPRAENLYDLDQFRYIKDRFPDFK